MSSKLPQPQPLFGVFCGAVMTVMAWWAFSDFLRVYPDDFWRSASYLLWGFGSLLITPAFFLQVTRGPLWITRRFQTKLEQTEDWGVMIRFRGPMGQPTD